MPIANYTTDVKHRRSIAEIEDMLMDNGVLEIQKKVGDNGIIESLLFMIRVDSVPIYFNLNCNWREVLRELQRDRRVSAAQSTEKHAVDVAWRILRDLVRVQMAVIQSRQKTMMQLFLDDVVTKNGITLYEHVSSNRKMLLGDGKNESK